MSAHRLAPSPAAARGWSGSGRKAPVPGSEEQAIAAGPGGREVEYSVSIHVGGGDGRPCAVADPFRRGEQRSFGALRLRRDGSCGGEGEGLGTMRP